MLLSLKKKEILSSFFFLRFVYSPYWTGKWIQTKPELALSFFYMIKIALYQLRGKI